MTRAAATAPLRAKLAIAIEALIDVLDLLDRDPDLEPEIDTAADDHGERPGETFMELAA